MDFLANIPSWDDIERNLDHKFGAINQSIDQGLQSANDGWDGFTRRLSNGASQVYASHGGALIDHVRQALALSYPIVLSDLERKLASINITEILPVLLKLVREVVMIMGGSVAMGAGIGGAVGSLAFGAGALPGAAVGGSIGLEVGNIILMALGLASIAEYFCQNAGPCVMNLYHGLVIAWHAEEGLKPPGLDPTGGSAAMIQERTERAARQLASGQEQLVLLLLTAIVAFLMGRYSWNAGESVATRSFRLRSEITNKEFAEWLARNEQQLLKMQELQPKEPTPVVKLEPEVSAAPEPPLLQRGLPSSDKLIEDLATFKTRGISTQQAKDYLLTEDGQRMLDKLSEAAPTASPDAIYQRALGQLATGSTIPKMMIIDTPLVKIVPEGATVSQHSPFFTTYDELQKMAKADGTLADAFGLPLISEAKSYSVFEITPLSPTEVFRSKVAPTVELGGAIERSGDAWQYLTPNRKEWSEPKLIGTILNRSTP